MHLNKRICYWLIACLFFIPSFVSASNSVKSMVVFGDSISDIGNTTHLLKVLRNEESPSFIVTPFKIFVVNKMIDFANDYYVPQMVLDAGILVVTDFFDNDLAPYLVNLIAKVRLVPILPGKPYWKSRFSNGRVWNEYLAEMLLAKKYNKDTYLNKAFGGSWAATYDYQLTVWNLIRHPIGTLKTLVVGKLIPPSLGLIVQAYLIEHQKLNSDTVYFIYSGGNDYLTFLQFEDNYNIPVMNNYVENVIDSVGSALSKLIGAGARRFVVFGVPRIGDSPKYVHTTDRETLNITSDWHNERLEARIEEWKKQYPDADFLYINTEKYMAKARANPSQYGFSNITDACIDIKFQMFNAYIDSPFTRNYVLLYAQMLHYKDKSFAQDEVNYHLCDSPESYFFWDEIHPSTRAHKLLAFEVCSAMQAHGYDVACKAFDFNQG